MIEEMEKAKLEFEKKNYEQAIEHLDKVGPDSELHRFAQIFKANCLMELKKYGDALKIFNEQIRMHPYDQLLWTEKAFCHIRLNDNDGAVKALKEVDRVVDRSDKSLMVRVARLYDFAGDKDNALRYCDYALDIDSDFKEALLVKSTIVLALGDNDEINKTSDKLVEVSGGELLSLLPAFLMKLYSGNYRGCLDILNNSDKSNVDDEHFDMLKAVIFTHISDDLSVQLLMVDSDDLGIDDALNAMLDFVETGKDNGCIGGVQYYII